MLKQIAQQAFRPSFSPCALAESDPRGRSQGSASPKPHKKQKGSARAARRIRSKSLEDTDKRKKKTRIWYNTIWLEEKLNPGTQWLEKAVKPLTRWIEDQVQLDPKRTQRTSVLASPQSAHRTTKPQSKTALNNLTAQGSGRNDVK